MIKHILGQLGVGSVLEGLKLCLLPHLPASQPFPPSQCLQLLVLTWTSFVHRDPNSTYTSVKIEVGALGCFPTAGVMTQRE